MNKLQFISATVCVAFVSAAVYAEESIDALRRKESTLVQELDAIRAKIVQLESNGGDVDKDSPASHTYVRAFGIYEVNSAGGVELYSLFANPNAASPIKYINI